MYQIFPMLSFPNSLQASLERDGLWLPMFLMSVGHLPQKDAGGAGDRGSEGSTPHSPQVQQRVNAKLRGVGRGRRCTEEGSLSKANRNVVLSALLVRGGAGAATLLGFLTRGRSVMRLEGGGGGVGGLENASVSRDERGGICRRIPAPRWRGTCFWRS